MKKFKLVLLLLMGIIMMFAVVGCGKEKRLAKKTVYQGDNKGVYVYEYDKNGNMIKEMEYFDGRKYVNEEWECKGGVKIRHVSYRTIREGIIYEYELDYKGNPVVEKTYRTTGEDRNSRADRANWELRSETTYFNEYDTDGNLVAVYESEGDNKALVESHTYKFDDKGNIIEDKCTKDPDHSIYQVEYDKCGNMIYDKDSYYNDKKYTNRFEYDSRGRKIWQNKDSEYPIQYEYNDAGKLIKETHYRREKLEVFDHSIGVMVYKYGDEFKPVYWWEYEYK